jgi:hypothetical protein
MASHRTIAPVSILALLLTAAQPLRAQEQKPVIFAFDVEISLSDRAAARLKIRNESIVVSAYYSGDPKPSAGKHTNQIGTIDLGTENVEVIGAAGLVRVTGTKIDIDRLEWVKGPVMVNVNAYSGRHSSLDNILACDFFDGKLSSAVRKAPLLTCSLIEEKSETQYKH